MTQAALEKDGRIFEVSRLELPKTVEGRLGLLQQILTKPYVQKISMEVGKPVEVAWYRSPADSLLATAPEEDPKTTLSRVELVDLDEEDQETAVVSATAQVNLEGLVVSHFLCGDLKQLRQWMGLPRGFRFPIVEGASHRRLFGVPLIETDELQPYVLVVCGSKLPSSRLSDIIYAVKISM